MNKSRITERLDALGITQFEAAERAGKNSHFIYDYFAGRKKSFKGNGPVKIAQALQCSVEYLNGESDDIGVPPKDAPLASGPIFKGLPFAGVAEAGVFRKASAIVSDQSATPLAPSLSYPAIAQAAYVVRGDSLQLRGISEGMFLTTVAVEAVPDALRSGAIVIVRHTRLGGSEIEISARELQFFPDRTELISHPAKGQIDPVVIRDGATSEPDGKAEIVAIVVAATMVF